MRYIALVDGKVGAYGVVVPDLPGCTSAGSTTDEALRNAVEAVRLWAKDAIDDGEALPPPRSVEALRPEVAAALAGGAALAIVPLLLDLGRAVRANLSLDAGLLDAIDEAAKAHGLTRWLEALRGRRSKGALDRERYLSTHLRGVCRAIAKSKTIRLADVIQKRGRDKLFEGNRRHPDETVHVLLMVILGAAP